jgi:hypothetical protein
LTLFLVEFALENGYPLLQSDQDARSFFLARQDAVCEAFRALLPTITQTIVAVYGNQIEFTPNRLLPIVGPHNFNPNLPFRVLGYGVFKGEESRLSIPLRLVTQTVPAEKWPSVRLFFMTPNDPDWHFVLSAIRKPLWVAEGDLPMLDASDTRRGDERALACIELKMKQWQKSIDRGSPIEVQAKQLVTITWDARYPWRKTDLIVPTAHAIGGYLFLRRPDRSMLFQAEVPLIVEWLLSIRTKAGISDQGWYVFIGEEGIWQKV